MNRRQCAALGAAATLAALAGDAEASWIETTGIGSRPTALGGAYTAIADTPEAIYYNPAGLTQLLGDGRSTDQIGGFRFVDFSGYVIKQPVASGVSRLRPGGTVRNGIDYIFVQPDFRGGFEWSENVYVAPFSFTTPYAGFTKFSDQVGDQRFSSYEGSQIFINYSPRIAWRITDWLSIGGGPDIQAFNQIRRASKLGDGYALGGTATLLGTTTAEVERLFGALGVRNDGLDDGKLELRTDKEVPTGIRPVNDLDSNWRDVGFTVGIHARPFDWLRLGIVYRSELRVHVEGEAQLILFEDNPVLQFLQDLAATPLGPALGIDPPGSDKTRWALTFTTPNQIAAGAAIYLTDWWLLSTDVTWTNWQHARKKDRTKFLDGGLGPAIFDRDNDPSTPRTANTEAVVTRNFHNTLAWRIGSELELIENVFLRLGYWYDPHPQKDRWYAVDSGINDRDYYSVGLGVTGLFDGLLDIGASFQLMKFRPRRISVGESRNLGGTKVFVDPLTDGQADNTDFSMVIGGNVKIYNLDFTFHF